MKPAYVTVILNGVLLHNHQASLGPMSVSPASALHAASGRDAADVAGSHTPVHYRNIWITKIGAYDQP